MSSQAGGPATPPRRPKSSRARGSSSPSGALAIEWWPTEWPIPYTHNPRLVPEAAVEKVVASLAAYGFRQPIVVDAHRVIVVGHTRLLAAKRLGLERVPVHVATDLSPEQIKAYRLADNRTAQETRWDPDLLPAEIGELVTLACDLEPLGFDPKELAELLAPSEGLVDGEALPEVPREPITAPGELIALGEHRLLCGDATDGVAVARLMGKRRAVAMVTDPPYGVGYDGGNHPQTWGTGRAGRSTVRTKTRHWDDYEDIAALQDFYERFLGVARERALSERPVIYQWFAMTKVEAVLASWRAAGLLAHQTLIWDKSHAVLGRSD